MTGLEQKAIEIETVKARKERIVQIEGKVDGVSEHSETGFSGVRGNTLSVTLAGDPNPIKFAGVSGVKRDDYIKAGIILNRPEKEALYIEIFGEDGLFESVDFMDSYDPPNGDGDLEVLGIKSDLYKSTYKL